MGGVIQKFFIASMFMWMVPVAILYGFNHKLFPGSSDLSPHSLTLLSGFVAVISVNIVIAFYIYMAMKEPSDKHVPDPAFLAAAKASVNQFGDDSGKNQSGDSSKSLQSSKKQE
uniref:Vacuolar ATPase assembly integral membrane protein VMA21 homolog n=1 Tax=Cannabis sativa TaxID=3483 RepID=A0A803NPI3_CANSA